MSKLLGTTNTEGFKAEIRLFDDGGPFGRISFIGDLDVDADGGNGQNGKRASYMLGDKGLELLGNGGMAMRHGKVVGVTDWWKDIVFVGEDGNPIVLPNGVVPCKSSYQHPPSEGRSIYDRQADAASEPYIVIPSWLIDVQGIVKGCKASATYKGRRVFGFVGDMGPRKKVGEASIRMAELLGIESSPRSGGIDEAEVQYDFWPGVHAEVDGKVLALQRKNGTYVFPPAQA